MKITSLKELQKLIALCRKTGVDHVKVDGMEFHLGPSPKRSRKSAEMDIVTDPLAYTPVPKPNIKEETLPTPDQSLKEIAQKIAEDGLTPEQLLFYSVQDNPQ